MGKLLISVAIILLPSCTHHIIRCFELLPDKTADLTLVEEKAYSITNASDCYLIEDSLIVVVHNRTPDSHVLSILNKNDNHISHYYKYGTDDDCFLSTLSSVSSQGIFLHDYVKERFCLVKVPSDFSGESAPPIYHQTNVHSQFILATKTNRLLFLNPNSFNNRASRFVETDLNYLYQERKKYASYTYNVVSGLILADSEENHFMYADNHSGLVEIWQGADKLLCAKKIPDAESPDYYYYRKGKNLICIFKGAIPFTFQAGYSTDAFVVLVYDPYYIGKDEIKQYMYPTATLLFVDWTGNELGTCSLPQDLHPNSISITSDGLLAVYQYGERSIKETLYEIRF